MSTTLEFLINKYQKEGWTKLKDKKEQPATPGSVRVLHVDWSKATVEATRTLSTIDAAGTNCSSNFAWNLDRDTVLRVLRLLKDPEKMRSVAGMCIETAVWLKTDAGTSAVRYVARRAPLDAWIPVLGRAVSQHDQLAGKSNSRKRHGFFTLRVRPVACALLRREFSQELFTRKGPLRPKVADCVAAADDRCCPRERNSTSDGFLRSLPRLEQVGTFEELEKGVRVAYVSEAVNVGRRSHHRGRLALATAIRTDWRLQSCILYGVYETDDDVPDSMDLQVARQAGRLLDALLGKCRSGDGLPG